MNQAGMIYHLARADFLERVRRYSFLVMLGLAAFLGFQVAIGNIAVGLDEYRGEFNSAWVGSMMSLMTTFFVGWFGFYLVKGSVARDRDGRRADHGNTPLTAALPLGNGLQLFVLLAMVAVLALASYQSPGRRKHTIDLITLLVIYLYRLSLPGTGRSARCAV
jgi:hypothetical protein